MDYADKMLEYWWTTRTRCWIIGGLHGQEVGVLVDYTYVHDVGLLVNHTDTMLDYWWTLRTRCWIIGGLYGHDAGLLVD